MTDPATIPKSGSPNSEKNQDLLDISRIAAGKLRLNLQPIKLESVIETTIATFDQTAADQGITLVWQRTVADLERDAAVVWGDVDRLQQVMANLLTNAIKFTPSPGSVKLKLSVMNDGSYAEAPSAEIRVTDTGIGISADFLPHVFDRFRQAENSSSVKGLGLGLAIARHIIELHNGSIHVESAGAGQGTTFIIRLPLLLRSISETGNSPCSA